MAATHTPPWKALREAAGLSQREVGRRADINSGRMSIIERGVPPTDAEAARLRKVLLEAIEAMPPERTEAVEDVT